MLNSIIHISKSETAGLAFENILDEFLPLFDCEVPLQNYEAYSSRLRTGFHWGSARPRNVVWTYYQSSDDAIAEIDKGRGI
jgi:hypothetical protein